MPTYVHLSSFTDQGVQNIEDSADRLDDAGELAATLGGELEEFYLTFGQYDFVTVTEFPDDETAAEFALRVSSAGAIEMETLKAFPEDEYRDLVAGLS